MKPRYFLAMVALACCKRAPALSDTRVKCRDRPAPLELQLERALPVEGVDGLEPSALFLDGGQLRTVSDKHDTTIYALSLESNAAVVRTFMSFAAPSEHALDLEGLARADDGSWLLASEGEFRVLKVSSDGKTSWATPSLRARGEERGLFQKSGAGIEGIARTGSTLLLAAEREPRGLLESNGGDQWHAFAMPESVCPALLSRPNDFADLSADGEHIFALIRNSHLVLQLEKHAGVWTEGTAWSYARTENDPRFAYADRTFGLGEGLALDAQHVYVILDNNRMPRAAEPGDHRPLLFVFRRPTE